MKWMEMTFRHRRAVIVWVIVALVLAVVVTVALAQPDVRPGAGERDFGGRGGRDLGGMMGMRMMTAMAPPAIAVAGDAVFVVRGNMIYKFDAGTLELLAHAEIPELTAPPAPGQ